MQGKGVLKFGIKSKLLTALVLVLVIPLTAVGGLALTSMNRLGDSTVHDVRDMGNGAVNESTLALGELAKKKMVEAANGAAARTDGLISNAQSEATAIAIASRDYIERDDRAALASFLSTMYTQSPLYDYVEYDGRRTGERPQLYDSLFVFAANGTLLGFKGYDESGAGVGSRYGSSEYLTLAANSFRDAGCQTYVYDPFMHNATAKSSYWEPADNVEDVIVLPPANLKPFFVAIPSNLGALMAQTLEQQKSRSTRILALDGNWNTHQLGILLMVPVRKSGQLIGIAGLSMSLPAVTQFIREMKHFEELQGKQGYAYSFNRDSILTSHPTKDHIGSDSTYHWWVADMQKSDNGILEYTWRGVPKYTSFASVRLLGWKVAVTSPTIDFTRPAVDTGKKITAAINTSEQDIRASSSQVMNTIAVIAVVFVGATVAIGISLANRIVRPITDLTRLAEKISNGNLDAEVAVQSNDELGSLAEAFINLLTTLRLGNAAYFKGDLRKALESYRKGLALFETSVNEKGMAMCYNNMGNIFRQWKEYGEAEEHYRKALEIATRTGDRKAIAARYSNLGLLYHARGDNAQATAHFETAMKLYNELGDGEGIATVYNNIGIMKKENGDPDAAMDHFQKALKMDKEARNERGMATRYNNIALLYKARGELQKALQCLDFALSIDQKLEDAASAYTSLRNLAVLYDALGQPEKSQELAVQAAAMKESLKRSKSVMFVMDRSGSMDGDRIISAKQGAKNVLDHKIYDEDRVGIIQFDHDSEMLLPLTKKKKNADLIAGTIDSISLRGMTAFYDALGDALLQLKENGGGDILWVVALTDGEDNSSQRFTPRRSGWLDGRTVLSDWPDQLGIDVNIIIIGVGNQVDSDTLREVCKGHGSYIHVSETAEEKKGIIEAFRKVEELFEESEVVEEYVPEK